MTTKTLMKIAAAAFAVTCINACSHNDGSSASPAASDSTAASAVDTVPSTAPYVPGTAVSTQTVSSDTTYAAGGSAESSSDLATLIAAYPVLGTDIADVQSVDHGVVTNDGRLELYKGAALVVALNVSNSSAATVEYSSDSAFAPTAASFTTTTDAKGNISSSVTFDFQACTTPAPAPVQGKGDQGQGQGKTPPPAPTCESISNVVMMAQAAPPTKQGQCDQGQGKDGQGQCQQGQGQGKGDQGQSK